MYVYKLVMSVIDTAKNTKSRHALSYRPDIDGLRAISVLAVMFYHAEFEGFSGGFIGVDVFFVISGYLITQMVLKDFEEGAFQPCALLRAQSAKDSPCPASDARCYNAVSLFISLGRCPCRLFGLPLRGDLVQLELCILE